MAGNVGKATNSMRTFCCFNDSKTKAEKLVLVLVHALHAFPVLERQRVVPSNSPCFVRSKTHLKHASNKPVMQTCYIVPSVLILMWNTWSQSSTAWNTPFIQHLEHALILQFRASSDFKPSHFKEGFVTVCL
jgi:hypothetical protein